MSYPLPGETVVRTLRDVEFGMGYSRDEPAPAEVAAAVRALWHLERLHADALQQWEREQTHAAWGHWRVCSSHLRHRYNDLLRLMGKHRYKSFLIDGHRIRLVIEPRGCRRHHVEITEVPE